MRKLLQGMRVALTAKPYANNMLVLRMTFRLV